MTVIFKLKDCNVVNIYNSFTDEHYDPDYYGCPTCGGADVPESFEIKIVTDKHREDCITFYGDEAAISSRLFLPWVIDNQGRFEDKELYKFLAILEKELLEGEKNETSK